MSIDLIDDIEIPVIEITDGWPVTDIKTLEDCDDAFAYLTAALAGIEYQIETDGFKPIDEQRGGEWVARAKSALRFKRAALSIVNTRRGSINRAIDAERQDNRDRQLLAFIRDATQPEEWIRMVTAFNTGRLDKAA